MGNPILYFNTHIFQAISKFESMVNQIQKNAKDINQRLRMIECGELFKTPPSKFGQLPSCKVNHGVAADFGRISKEKPFCDVKSHICKDSIICM